MEAGDPVNQRQAHRAVMALMSLGVLAVIIIATIVLWNQRDVVDKCIESGGSYLPRSAICVGPDGRIIPQ